LRWLKSYPFWVCILLASVLWYLYYLFNPASFSVKLEIECSGLKSGYIVSSQSAHYVPVSFTVEGKDVNRVRDEFSKFVVSVDLGSVDLSTADSIVKVAYLLTPIVKQQINNAQKSNLQFDIKSDSLYLTIEKVSSKKVPLKDEFEFTLPNGYMPLHSSGYSVDSVVVSGLVSDLDKVDYISCGRKKLGKIKEKKIFIFYPERYYRKLIIDPDTLLYVVDVDNFTENIITVPINFSDSIYEYKFFPSEINIRYNVSVHDYFVVTPSMFGMNVIFDDSSSNIAYILVDRCPSFIDIVDFYPTVYEYLMFEK
jgi:hypothetical protein